MNPPAYTAAPALGEVRTVAPSPGDRKHTYVSVDPMRSDTNLEVNNLNESGVGMEMATYSDSPLETDPPGAQWGGSTAGGISEPEETLLGEQTRPPGKDSLSDIVAGVRAGIFWPV